MKTWLKEGLIGGGIGVLPIILFIYIYYNVGTRCKGEECIAIYIFTFYGIPITLGIVILLIILGAVIG